MALQKTIKTPYGVDADYHRISDFQFNGTDIQVGVESYATAEARQSGAQPIFKQYYHFTKSRTELEKTASVFTVLYDLLKAFTIEAFVEGSEEKSVTLPFEGAIDV